MVRKAQLLPLFPAWVLLTLSNGLFGGERADVFMNDGHKRESSIQQKDIAGLGSASPEEGRAECQWCAFIGIASACTS
ncbi:MAG: hypothetical protein GXY64_02425 [Bacteroidales bacterium]|nr:hypothetical protein [Bacteroidales bacterium]